MKNFIFNTTRQWNCGDEFILKGCINLLKNRYNFNSIIYNRNPDIRCDNGRNIFLKNEKLPLNITEDIIYIESKYRFGFNDNSIKYNSDLSYVDLAVFAGSPEWCNERCINFFEHIIKNNIPSIILGIGNINPFGGNYNGSFIEDVINKSLIFSVRSRELLDDDLSKRNNAIYLPCPALFSSTKEKQIEEVKKIGLCFGVSYQYSVKCNCINDDCFNYIKGLYVNLIKKYKNIEFSIVCHYIDELPVAHKLFDEYNVDILYSFDSEDYVDIYGSFDAVISSRVHGCGISASLGIPTISISHDARGKTTEGFLSNIITTDTTYDYVYKILDNIIDNARELNNKIVKHKQEILEKYLELFDKKISFDKIKYDYYDFSNIYKISLINGVINENKSWFKKVKYPKWLCNLFCIFIPNKKNRDHFRKKYGRKYK